MTRTPPYQRTSSTSRRAAMALVTEGRLLDKREQVRRFIAERGDYGATREEVALGMGLRIQSVCGRVAELLEHIPGEPPALQRTDRERKTTSGRNAEVLIATGPMPAPAQMPLLTPVRGLF
jgi:hypothetical protein